MIHSVLSEIQQASSKVIELSDGLTKQLGLQEALQAPDHAGHDLLLQRDCGS